MDPENNKPVAFMLPKDELATLLIGNLNLTCNQLSRYAGITEEDSVTLSDTALEVLRDDRFKRVANILTQPMYRISAMKGGNLFDLETLTVYAVTSAGGYELTSVLNAGDTAVVIYFQTITGFIDWWAGMFAGRIEFENPLVNFIPSTLCIEEFVFLVHLIDCFKRAYMESMLSYKPVKDLKIEASLFLDSLDLSLKSGDVRWLLPAVFALTPGLTGINLNLKAEFLKKAEDLQFISMLENAKSKELQFVYLNSGVSMGYDFATTWLYGLGWDFKVLDGNNIQTISQKFLAPTATVNHLFTALKDPSGTYEFSYLPLTFEGFKQHLTEWFKELQTSL